VPESVERIFHSDRIYSAVGSAMAQLGWLEEWIRDTFTSGDGPAVRFSSFFPSVDGLLLVSPPRHLWPPSPSIKVRWRGARFVPLSVVAALAAEQPVDEGRWVVDGASECLVPAERPHGPFRVGIRSAAAVDRVDGHIQAHSTGCIEFGDGAGMWLAAAFASEAAKANWCGRLSAALRLLADSGFGGRRSWGWGRSACPEVAEGWLPDLILPAAETSVTPEAEPTPPPETAYWLLSLFSPAPDDSVDWTRGAYTVLVRSGRVESPFAWGALKKTSRMIGEGSVLLAAATVRGAAVDVTPEGVAHPVYRAGYAFSIPVPWRVSV
jgi:CRISPR type III-A-associated RAMP protein Csm4